MDQDDKIFQTTEEKKRLEHQIHPLKTTCEKMPNKNHNQIPPHLKKIKSVRQAKKSQLAQKLNELKKKNNSLQNENDENSRFFIGKISELKGHYINKIAQLKSQISDRSTIFEMEFPLISNLKKAYKQHDPGYR